MKHVNPFIPGELYIFTKFKPPLAPIYQKNDKYWIGTTRGIDLQFTDYKNKILLCLDSIKHRDITLYSGIFLFDDQIIGLSPEWVKKYEY